jgi:hypothetical protein
MLESALNALNEKPLTNDGSITPAGNVLRKKSLLFIR